MAWRHRVRLLIGYLTIVIAVGLSLVIPLTFREAINMLVVFEDGVIRAVEDTKFSALVVLGLILLAASVIRGFVDFARTYCTDSLSQKVAYDVRVPA